MRRWLFPFSICMLFLVLLCSCQDQTSSTSLRLSGQTMGTTWSVLLLPEEKEIDSDHLKQVLQERLNQINALMSTYDPESELSQFNSQTNSDWFTLSEETAHVIEISQQISALSEGAFDISVGPLVDLWGFGATVRREKVPSKEQISERLDQVGYEKIQLKENPTAIRKLSTGLQLDLSAIAKGYAVDALADILRQKDINNYLLEVGGELRIAGHREDGTPWQIAIEKPLEGVREVSAIFPLTDTGLATSGNYRNFYIEDGQRYSHTINPLSGRPIRHKLASVTVLAETCARADALATTLMVLGEEKGRLFCEKNQIAAYFLIHDTTSTIVYTSPAFSQFLNEVK